MSNILGILNKARKRKEKFDIITFDTHERYQTQLAKTGHNFYSFSSPGMKKWDLSYAKYPDNYFTMPENSLVSGIDFDFILSQSKFGQFQMAKRIQQAINVPIVSLEHTLPIPSWPNEQFESFRSMVGDFNVFISEYSRGEWLMKGDVIHHSVDANTFKIRDDHMKNGMVLSVVNDFVNRDYCCNYSGWKRITDGIDTRLVGNTPNLSTAAASIEDLVKEYQSASVFLNTSTISPVPTALLEAMACGCAVVSTATCMIPEIIKNGVNGFISNDESELRGFIKTLLESPTLARQIGLAARETILKDFSEEKFLSKWNQIFNKCYEVK